jgi:hypothetical protein
MLDSNNQNNNISISRPKSSKPGKDISMVNYTPYTLQEYKEIADNLDKINLGGLGANIGSEEWLKKMEKQQKQKTYAEEIKKKNNQKIKITYKNPEEERKEQLKKKYEESNRHKAQLYCKTKLPVIRKRNESYVVDDEQKTFVQENVNTTNNVDNKSDLLRVKYTNNIDFVYDVSGNNNNKRVYDYLLGLQANETVSTQKENNTISNLNQNGIVKNNSNSPIKNNNAEYVKKKEDYLKEIEKIKLSLIEDKNKKDNNKNINSPNKNDHNYLNKNKQFIQNNNTIENNYNKKAYKLNSHSRSRDASNNFSKDFSKEISPINNSKKFEEVSNKQISQLKKKLNTKNYSKQVENSRKDHKEEDLNVVESRINFNNKDIQVLEKHLFPLDDSLLDKSVHLDTNNLDKIENLNLPENFLNKQIKEKENSKSSLTNERLTRMTPAKIVNKIKNNNPNVAKSNIEDDNENSKEEIRAQDISTKNIPEEKISIYENNSNNQSDNNLDQVNYELSNVALNPMSNPPKKSSSFENQHNNKTMEENNRVRSKKSYFEEDENTDKNMSKNLETNNNINKAKSNGENLESELEVLQQKRLYYKNEVDIIKESILNNI